MIRFQFKYHNRFTNRLSWPIHMYNVPFVLVHSVANFDGFFSLLSLSTSIISHFTEHRCSSWLVWFYSGTTLFHFTVIVSVIFFSDNRFVLYRWFEGESRQTYSWKRRLFWFPQLKLVDLFFASFFNMQCDVSSSQPTYWTRFFFHSFCFIHFTCVSYIIL